VTLLCVKLDLGDYNSVSGWVADPPVSGDPMSCQGGVVDSPFVMMDYTTYAALIQQGSPMKQLEYLSYADAGLIATAIAVFLAGCWGVRMLVKVVEET